MDKLHRTDGPAIENGQMETKEWWMNGKRHREDGPAIETVQTEIRPKESWYLNGELSSYRRTCC
jgi:hypothetical protein